MVELHCLLFLGDIYVVLLHLAMTLTANRKYTVKNIVALVSNQVALKF